MPTIHYKDQRKKYKTIKNRPVLVQKPQRALIRVLYGEVDKDQQKRACRLILGLNQWAKDNISYFVLGKDNYNFLKDNGAKTIYLVDKKSSLHNNCTHWYNKTFLIDAALEIYNEIVYTDCDARILRTPDHKMWKTLRNKKGEYQGTLQVCIVRYRRSKCSWRSFGNIVLNGACMYCRDRMWTKAFIKIYSKPEAISWCDEGVMSYYVDSLNNFKFDLNKLVDNFHTNICLERRIMRQFLYRYSRNNIYFSHYVNNKNSMKVLCHSCDYEYKG